MLSTCRCSGHLSWIPSRGFDTVLVSNYERNEEEDDQNQFYVAGLKTYIAFVTVTK